MNWKKITVNKIKNRVVSEISRRTQKEYDNTKPEDYKKVLHIWDMAGVSSLLTRELRKHGYVSDVLMREEHDGLGITKYYGHKTLKLEGNPFDAYCKQQAENYGIIHIHSVYELVPKYKKAFPNKKIVLHFHGNELRHPTDKKKLVECSKLADAIVCSTPDLTSFILEYGVPKPIVCLNAVDTDLFKPMPEIQKITNKALYTKIRYLNFERTMKHLKEKCPWEFEIFDRDAEKKQFYEMPEFYNKYSRMIDIKYTEDTLSEGMSKSALEALACGLEVYTYKDEIIKGLPEEYTPDYQCDTIMKVYDDIK